MRWLLLRALASGAYPECLQQGVVYRHAGAHGIFVDVSLFGSKGCWRNDCLKSDKFEASEASVCARACWQLPECLHWSFSVNEKEALKEDVKEDLLQNVLQNVEENVARNVVDANAKGLCFLRKSRGGLEPSEAFVSGSKACAPPALPDAWLARTAAKVAKSCDGCDVLRAMTTWRFAIEALKRTLELQVLEQPQDLNHRGERRSCVDSKCGCKCGLSVIYTYFRR